MDTVNLAQTERASALVENLTNLKGAGYAYQLLHATNAYLQVLILHDSLAPGSDRALACRRTMDSLMRSLMAQGIVKEDFITMGDLLAQDFGDLWRREAGNAGP